MESSRAGNGVRRRHLAPFAPYTVHKAPTARISGLAALDEKQPHPRDTAWAMSEENVELVRRTYEAAYEAGSQADYDAVVSYFHPEIEFHAYPRSPEVGVYHGKQALREYI